MATVTINHTYMKCISCGRTAIILPKNYFDIPTTPATNEEYENYEFIATKCKNCDKSNASSDLTRLYPYINRNRPLTAPLHYRVDTKFMIDFTVDMMQDSYTKYMQNNKRTISELREYYQHTLIKDYIDQLEGGIVRDISVNTSPDGIAIVGIEFDESDFV